MAHNYGVGQTVSILGIASTASTATFTATGSGTNLTTSAVTGFIAIGAAVSGTGIPANTNIVSQTSGTTGGAGVYVTNNATTSVAASVTSTFNAYNFNNAATASGTTGTTIVVTGAGTNPGSYTSGGWQQPQVNCGDYPPLDGLDFSCYSCLTIKEAKMTKKTNQLTAPQFDKLFPNEEACDNYLVANRWPKGVHCPRCGSTNVYPLQTMKFKWECSDCREGGAYRFSHLVGTIFENTKVDLKDWFKVIHLMLGAKKGISAMQIQRHMGFGSYKTAWYVCHRIRTALQDKEFRKLMGIVEVDETFIGGKGYNKHKSKRGHDHKHGLHLKTAIIGAVERKGSVVTRVLGTLSAVDMQRFVRETVSTKVSLLATDEQVAYKGLGEYPHGYVKHSAKQYVCGAVHTQTIEGFWSIFKRSIVGSYHKVSEKYLPLYIAECQFKYNNRFNDDIFGTAIEGC